MDDNFDKNLENIEDSPSVLQTSQEDDLAESEVQTEAQTTENLEENSEESILLNEDLKDVPKKKKKRKKRKKHSWIAILIVTVLIVAISLALAMGIIYVGKDIFAIDKEASEIYVDIPQGATTLDIANILYENDIIEYPMFFRLVSKLSKSDGGYLYGYFLVSPSMTYSDLIDTLQTEGEVKNIVNFTVPEGKNLVEIATMLEENGICGADEFIEYINDTEFGYNFETKLSDGPLIFFRMEGYAFPDTYTFYKDEDVEDVCRAFLSNFENKFTEQMYARMEELGLDLNKLMTLASVIESESAATEQMEYISSVFWNRINAASDYPKWQSNVTTEYVDNVIKPQVNKITAKNEKYLDVYEAYDTYKCDGFPAGPICNPGMNAITATLYPADTDYLYFCHNPKTGEIYYADNLDDHGQNMIKAGLI